MFCAASMRARLLLCSPSAAMTSQHQVRLQHLYNVGLVTLARASLAASASAAMALISCSGTRTSFTWTQVVREDDLWVKGACRVGHCHGRGLTSTLSTATPQYSVPSASRSWHCYKNVDSDSRVSEPPTCISCAILTRSERMSPRVRVPSTFRSVVAASACADPA